MHKLVRKHCKAHTCTDGQTVYARVQKVGQTAKVVPVILLVKPQPVAFVSQLQMCPDKFDGPTVTFMLPNADKQASGNVVGLTVTYHASETEAELGLNLARFALHFGDEEHLVAGERRWRVLRYRHPAPRGAEQLQAVVLFPTKTTCTTTAK